MVSDQSFFINFVKKEQINYDAWNFYFKKPTNFKYQAGQYIKIKLPIKKLDNRGNSRYFTLSSSPTEEYLRITTRIIKSTFKMELSKLVSGEKVEFRGPWGDFVLDDKDVRQRIFLAGGIGLTPFRSILKYSADMGLNIPVFMINSYKSEKDAQLSSILDEFKKLENFKLKIILERITTQFLQKDIDLTDNNIYYIAGPEKMVTSLAKELKKLSLSEDNIKIDDFPGY